MYHQQRHSYACQKGTSFLRIRGSITLMTFILSTYRGKYQSDFAFLSFYANCMIFLLNTCNSGELSINSPLWSSNSFLSGVTRWPRGRSVIFLQVFQWIERVFCSHTKDGCTLYIDIRCPFFAVRQTFLQEGSVNKSGESETLLL